MHRIKGAVDKKEQEGNSSGSSHRKRRKKYGKVDKPGYHQEEWTYQHLQSHPRGFAPNGNVRIDRMGHFWDVPESVPAAPRVLAPPADPGLCRYAVPATPAPYFPYTYGPFALAVCQEPNFYQAPSAAPAPHLGSTYRVPSHSSVRSVQSNHSNHSKSSRSERKPVRSSKCKTVQNSALNRSSTNDCHPSSRNYSHNEYLSLPPGMQDPCSVDDSHRRFSDPGLGHPNSDTDSNLDGREGPPKCEPGTTSTESESSLLEDWPAETLSLVEQVKLLRADNKRLARELRETRAELHQLKLQTPTWRGQKSEEYQPGMIADLVREVRDAAKLQEETLLTRLRFMVSDGSAGRLSGSTSVQSVYGEATGAQNNNKNVVDREVAERLSRLEDQLEGLRLSKGNDTYREERQSPHSLERILESSEKPLTSDLSEGVKLRKEPEINSLKLASASVARKNGSPNCSPNCSPNIQPVVETETEESLASMCSSTLSSLSAPHAPSACVTMTMTGPVTDL